MRYLKTNTAVIVTVGPFYDKTTGVDIEGALTISNERITFVADNDDGSAPTVVLDNITGATTGTSNDLNYLSTSAGLMQLELTAANLNRLGRALLSVTDAANHVPVFHEFMIVPANWYEANVKGTEWQEVTAHAPRVVKSGNDLVIYKQDDTTEQFRNVGTFASSASTDVLTELAGKT